jgi:hypothetical protein
MDSADCLLGKMKRKSFLGPQGGLGLRGNVFIDACEIGFAHSDFTLLLGFQYRLWLHLVAYQPKIITHSMYVRNANRGGQGRGGYASAFTNSFVSKGTQNCHFGATLLNTKDSI